MKETIIYKIENLLNGKVYVGQTQDFRKRKYYHKQSLNKKKSHCTKLQNAWNKYGEDSFKFEVIEFCHVDSLNEREVFWIEKLDSVNTGYNLEKGGKKNKQISEETKKLMSINNPRVWKDKKWGEHNISKEVHQYDLEGNYIQSFGNAYEASEKTKIGQKVIQSAAKGDLQSGGSFQWSYSKHKVIPVYIKNKAIPYNEKPVIMIDSVTGNYLREFESAAKAEKFLNKNKNKIFEICKGSRIHWAGYKWRYKD